MTFFLRLLARILYRFRAEGTEVLRGPGPLLLCPNHNSWLDWLFVYVCLGDDWKFVASSTTAQVSWIHRRMMINSRTFPVDNTSAFALRGMVDYLNAGGKLVLFPEGRISATGNLMKVYDGTAFLAQHSPLRIITCHLRNAVRVPWVRHKGWTLWFPRVSAHFSPALTPPAYEGVTHSAARAKLTRWLRDQLMVQQLEVEMRCGAPTLPAAIAETVASIPRRIAYEDINFTEMNFRRVAVGAELLGTQWRRRFGPATGERIGILLPNVTATAVAIVGLWSVGKVPAFLNFSAGGATMLACAQLAGLRRVITSRKFLEKARLHLEPLTAAGIEFVYLEDVREGIGGLSRLAALLANVVRPGAALRRAPCRAEDVAAIIFTSGSEGMPKGVELTHRGMLADLRQLFPAVDLRDDERLFNALPFFHSFGLVGGIVAPLVRGLYCFLYPSPLHYRIVPTLVYEKNCTVMLATNTFLNGYARRAHPYDLYTVRYLVAGAEKVQQATADLYSRKFGVRIHEGYGATECGPVVCINSKIDPNTGSAGRLLPGVETRIEPVEGVPQGGRLFVRTPAMMKGYLNPDANAAFQALNGWYDTGDIVHIDDDGYVYVLGRLKRFAKVSGEMVSLTAVEDTLAGAFPNLGPRCQIVILSVPDTDKGEKLIAFANDRRLQLAEVRAAVRQRGLSNLCAPRELRYVESIPKLGSGKTDYRSLQRELAAGAPPAESAPA